MSEWARQELKDNSYLRGRIGWQGLRASEFLDEGPYLVTGTDFEAGKINWDTCYHVSERRFQEAAYIQLRDFDLLITKDGTIGKIALVTACPEKAVLNSGIFLLRCKDGSYLHEFAYHVLNSEIFSGFLRRKLNGSTINHLYQYVFETFPLPVPQIETQRKIASILTAIDKAIEKTEALIEKYSRIKAGMMQDLFTRGLTADGKLRPSRAEAPELYQKTPIGWIPKEWSLVQLDQLKETLIDGPFGSNLKTEHYVADPGVRVVRLQNIQSGNYNDKDRAFISGTHANSLNRNKVSGGDVLIAGLGEERYPVGRACLYPASLPEAVNKADCFRLRCKRDVMLNAFAMHFLNTPLARSQVQRYEQGVTRPRVNTGNLNRILVPKPSVEEQRNIIGCLANLTRQIELEIAKTGKLRRQKSGLMHDLLSGKVPVKLDEPELENV